MAARRTLKGLERRIPRCQRCSRLITWCRTVAHEKRAAFADEDYWGRPVSGFGDHDARVLVVGLAPAAHGANRTGRIFTGDRSGEWLYRTLHVTGFANQASHERKNDGLQLRDVYVTCVVRCAPPQNRPTTSERDSCLPYLVEEIGLLTRLRVIVALGGFGWSGALRALADHGHRVRPRPKFGHGAQTEVGPYTMLGAFHPSQQNTFTGRLTQPMFEQVFERARGLID